MEKHVNAFDKNFAKSVFVIFPTEAQT
jgi:hypothetical protein